MSRARNYPRGTPAGLSLRSQAIPHQAARPLNLGRIDPARWGPKCAYSARASQHGKRPLSASSKCPSETSLPKVLSRFKMESLRQLQDIASLSACRPQDLHGPSPASGSHKVKKDRPGGAGPMKISIESTLVSKLTPIRSSCHAGDRHLPGKTFNS